MNIHKQFSNSCKIGIKAYQNLVGSLSAFDHFVSFFPLKEHIILSSIFCFAVVKYSKPFIETQTPFGKVRYPVRHLKKESDFNNIIHNQLLELRNTLVAHDDIESIEPKLLEFCMKIDPIGFNIPVSVALSNKCLAYPVNLENVLSIRKHIVACIHGTLHKLNNDLAEVRNATLKYPEQTSEETKYQNNYGKAKIEAIGSHFTTPDFMKDEWLNCNEPNFSHIHNGLLYEELKIRRDFYGPEVITLPDGGEVHLSPPCTQTTN